VPKRYHDAVELWRQTYLPDYDYLLDNWERFFPREPKFRLCAYREMGCPARSRSATKPKPKARRACQMRRKRST
jgi:hypothetical protein